MWAFGGRWISFSLEKKGLVIATQDSAIAVLEIQGENSKKMPVGDYLRGNMIKVGEKFS